MPPIIELGDEDVDDDVIELVSIKRAVIAPPSVMHDEARTHADSDSDLARDHFETNILRRGHIKRRLIALGLVAAVVLACPWAANIAPRALDAKTATPANAVPPAKNAPPAKNNVKAAPQKPHLR